VEHGACGGREAQHHCQTGDRSCEQSLPVTHNGHLSIIGSAGHVSSWYATRSTGRVW
jgi:hypothetical protein